MELEVKTKFTNFHCLTFPFLYSIVLCYINKHCRSGGEVSELGRDIVDHCHIKRIHMNKCIILNVYQDTAV